MKSILSPAAVAVLALCTSALAEEASQPAALTLHARLTKDGVSIESTTAASNPTGVLAEGEMWIECRQIKISALGTPNAAIECLGDIHVRARWRHEFEAHADRVMIESAGKCLEFLAEDGKTAELWGGLPGSEKRLTSHRIKWRIDVADDDTGFFRDFSDEGGHRKSITSPALPRNK